MGKGGTALALVVPARPRQLERLVLMPLHWRVLHLAGLRLRCESSLFGSTHRSPQVLWWPQASGMGHRIGHLLLGLGCPARLAPEELTHLQLTHLRHLEALPVGVRGAAPAQSVGFLLLAGPTVLFLAEDVPRLVADHLGCPAEDLLERASLPVAGALEGPEV